MPNSFLLRVGVTGFEPATTRPPDVYSNRAELHPVCFSGAKVAYSVEMRKLFLLFLCKITGMVALYII